MTRKTRAIGVLLCAALLCTGSPSFGAGPEAYAAAGEDVRTVLQFDLVGQTNPEGLMLSAGGYRRWITGRDEMLGIPSRYLQTGFTLATTPAYGRASVHAEWLAAVFAKLRFQYDLYRYYGMNTSLLSFPSADSPFDSAEVDALDGMEEKGWGTRVLLRPTLYAKAGPVLIVNQTDLAYFRFPGTGPYFLDWTYETLLKDGDAVVENRTNILYEILKGTGEVSLMAGPYYEVMRTGAADLRRQRAGIMVYWVPWERLGSWDRPRVFAQVGRYLEDRNRDGEYMTTFGIGFDLDR